MTSTEPERPGNHGAQLLSMAIKAKDISINAAGKMAGTPSGYISRLLSGKRKPSRRVSLTLHDLFNVPPGAWDEALPDAEESEPDELAPVVVEAR